jgi:CRP/FNR family transcriptional regulator, cyclic AMP receptor protein
MTQRSPSIEGHALRPDLSGFGILKHASARIQHLIMSQSHMARFSHHEICWSQDQDTYLGIVSGRCRLQTRPPIGQDLTVDILGPGYIVGLTEYLSGTVVPMRCTAISEVLALVIPKTVLQTAIRTDTSFARELLAIFTKEIVTLRQRLGEMASLSVLGRVAAFIVRQSDLNQAQPDFHNPPTHEDLAALLGSNREAITRAFRTLETSAIINYSRTKIKVLDFERLEALSRNHATALRPSR